MTRREALQLLASLGVSACSGRLGSRRIEGSIVGASHARGHLVRERLRPAPARSDETDVAIIGAGVAGLSAAWTLERAGLEGFALLELEDVPGGTSRSGVSPVSAFPWGAHYVPAPPASNRPLVKLLDEVGAVRGHDAAGAPVWAEEALCRDPQERLFDRGAWTEGLYPRAGASRADLVELGRFEQEMGHFASARDAAGRRAFAVPRSRGSGEPELRALDGRSMADWLAARGYRSERLLWLIDYGCRDDFGSTLAQTSAWAGIHYHAARLEEPGGDPAPLLTWPEGNGRLVQHLAAMAGPRLRTGAVVLEVLPLADRVDVTWLDARTGECALLRARHAVFALPRFLVRHLVPSLRAAPPAHLAATVYGSWMVANLTLSDRPVSRGFPLSWDNVLYRSPSLGYVTATHQSGRDHGATVLTYYLPLVDDDRDAARARLLATPWEVWVERILADLAPAHPGIDKLVERIDVYRWGHAMVVPRPGFLWSEALEASARPLGRLHFAHTDLSGMALFEEAHEWGIRAAEAILEARGHAFRSWLS